MKGYQFLEMDFFDMCETRKIQRLPQLLYIYLRGLYCRFQKPTFSWSDRIIRGHLGVTQTTLATLKDYLQERALIKFTSGTGRTPTQYTMLGAVMLPELRVLKIKTLPKSSKHQEGLKNCDPYNTSNQRLNNRIGVFQGMTKEDKEALKTRGLL